MRTNLHKMGVENSTYILSPLRVINKLYKRYIHKKYLHLIVMAFFLMISIAAATSSIAYLIKPVVNKIFINKNQSQLYVICGLLCTIITLKSLLTYLQNVVVHMLHEYIMKDLRKDMFQKLIKLPLNQIQNMTSGKFITYFMTDVQVIGESLSIIFISSIRELLTIVFLVVIVFYHNPYLASLAFILFPAVLLPLARLSRSLRQKYFQTQTFYDALGNKLADIINGIKTIKVYNAENYEIRSFTRILLQILQMSISYKKKGSIGSPVTECVSGISIALVIFYGGKQVIYGYSDAGSFFSFITSLIMAYKPAKSLSGINMRAQTCSISLSRIFDFLEKARSEDTALGETIDLITPEIKFENVSFSYRFENNTQVTMNNISFTIKHGEKVAFVGSSGSGKSTILNLLMGLYNIQAGKITINDINIQDISMKCLRNNVSYIGQDSFMFDDSILHNITYHMKSKKVPEVIIQEVLKMAKIDFLHTMPNGINEYAGYSGAKLSLGQKQRINIARGILKDAPVVVLDEATSALDAITEREIRDMIFDYMKNKTLIMVAHRLSTVVKCDRIYVVDNGQIAEIGTHDELLAKNGKYAELWNDY